ncbi:MAG: hypothetical protein E7618_04970 [Ruminococcaceae bacterium]|nr:hypothetical protein [Oscillospiraceae bacterium]
MPKRPLRKRLADSMDVPEIAFGGCPYLTVEGNTSLRVDHCLEILSYDDREIRLALRGLILIVHGEALTMRSYAIRTICIGGRITALCFEEKKK